MAMSPRDKPEPAPAVFIHVPYGNLEVVEDLLDLIRAKKGSAFVDQAWGISDDASHNRAFAAVNFADALLILLTSKAVEGLSEVQAMWLRCHLWRIAGIAAARGIPIRCILADDTTEKTVKDDRTLPVEVREAGLYNSSDLMAALYLPEAPDPNRKIKGLKFRLCSFRGDDSGVDEIKKELHHFQICPVVDKWALKKKEWTPTLDHSQDSQFDSMAVFLGTQAVDFLKRREVLPFVKRISQDLQRPVVLIISEGISPIPCLTGEEWLAECATVEFFSGNTDWVLPLVRGLIGYRCRPLKNERVENMQLLETNDYIEVLRQMLEAHFALVVYQMKIGPGVLAGPQAKQAIDLVQWAEQNGQQAKLHSAIEKYSPGALKRDPEY